MEKVTEQTAEALSADEGRERLTIPSSSVPGEPVPERVLIAPWGEVDSVNGAFVMDEDSGRAAVAHFTAHGTDLPIDYEHQSLGGSYSSPTGQAPAAGWIRSLVLVPPGGDTAQEPGLYAEVTWTPTACKQLQAREYRYISPVVIVRKEDRRVVALHSAALTNKPAISHMQPIVNRAQPAPERERAEASTNGAGASVVQCAIPDDTQGATPPVLEMLCHRLGLAADSDVEEVLTAAEAKLAALTEASRTRSAVERVEAALRAGKLTGAQREWAMELALKDVASFEAWEKSAPVLVATGRVAGLDAAHGSSGQSDTRRRAIVASARRAFQAEPHLASVTSEEAWIAEALREAGFEPSEDAMNG